MYGHQLFVKTLSEFTRVLLTPYEIHTALGELADRVTDVLGLAGSGVSLVRDGRLEFDTAYGSAIAEDERTQERVQVGPCVTAFKTGKIVAVTDLTTRTPPVARLLRRRESGPDHRRRLTAHETR